MKFSESWLREWIDPDINTTTLVNQLTNAGLEASVFEQAAGKTTGVVVGEINNIQPHPNASNLTICQVSDGQDTLSVVCRVTDIRIGMKVVFAKANSRLPAGVVKKTSLNGIESMGRLCSGEELGMSGSDTGLIELPENAVAGQAVDDYLQPDDAIINLDLTPNRADCLSILGIAREVAVINGLDFSDRDTPPIAADIDDRVEIQLDAIQDCPAYIGRVIRGVDVSAQTPWWMKEKLRRSGIRAIACVVDITNYVLLELGQPMHAFDLDSLNGAICVRYARQNETLRLLNDRHLELDPDVLVIADTSQPLALAGVMGGQLSAVMDQTSNIFLEAAFFNPSAIMGRARRYGLHTESSHRFERGVDPYLQQRAIERATALIVQICGGQAGPAVPEKASAYLPKRPQITLHSKTIDRLLGITVSNNTIERQLRQLRIDYRPTADTTWHCTAPSDRFDLNIEVDLIEEIARLHGYDKIPQSRPRLTQAMKSRPEYLSEVDSIKDILVACGWQEAMTYSFVDPHLQKELSPDRPAVNLINPLSSEMSQMRTSHWGGLIKALQYNQNHQQTQIKLFEAGLNFVVQDSAVEQKPWLSGVASGLCHLEQWGVSSRIIDFYDVKGDLQTIFEQLRRLSDFEFKAKAHPAFYPGQSAVINHQGRAVGWLGVLSPELENTLSVTGPVILFEIALSALTNALPRQFHAPSRFLENRRDLSIVVDEQLDVGAIFDVIRELADPIIKRAWIFDVYRGKNVESGRKSLSFGLILLHDLRTLTDEEIDQTLNKLIRVLGERFNATLRS